MKRAGLLSCATLLLACASWCQAAPIVNHADVNGLRTFQDQGTGLIWADLNNFFGLSYNQMKAAVESAGFTVADVTTVHGLLDTLPLTSPPTEWDTYAPIMGSAPNRALIWGAYLPESTSVSWAFAYQGDPAWSFDPNTGFGFDDVPNANTEFADMNIWAYFTGTPVVPEPSTVSLGASALALTVVGLFRRRRRATA